MNPLAYLKIAGIVAAALIIGTLALSVKFLYSENQTLKGNNIKLDSALKTQKIVTDAAIDRIDEVISTLAEQQGAVSDMMDIQRDANAETRRLNDLFAKHDIGRLALAKPGQIERIVNSGTADVFGVLMDETARGGLRGVRDTGDSEGGSSTQP